MRVFITNDDGFDAPGLLALINRFKVDHDVWVCAPKSQQSGASHAITLGRPLRLYKTGEQAFSVDGTPTDCVYMGIHQVMSERPDLLVSGINCGPNMGDDVTYSGTLAAAIEGTILGIPSIAVSVVGFKEIDWVASAEAAFRVADWVSKHPLPKRTLINLNVPLSATPDSLQFKLTKLGQRDYQQSVIARKDPRGYDYYWLGGNPMSTVHIDDSDIEATDKGLVSVTPITLDMTAHDTLQALQASKADQEI